MRPAQLFRQLSDDAPSMTAAEKAARKEAIIDAHIRRENAWAARREATGEAGDDEWVALRPDLDVVDDWPALGASTPRAPAPGEGWALVDDDEQDEQNETTAQAQAAGFAPRPRQTQRQRRQRQREQPQQQPQQAEDDWLAQARRANKPPAAPQGSAGVFRVSSSRSAQVSELTLTDPLTSLSNAGVHTVLSMLPPGSKATLTATSRQWHSQIASLREWPAELRGLRWAPTPVAEPDNELLMRVVVTQHNLRSPPARVFIPADRLTPRELERAVTSSTLGTPGNAMLQGIAAVRLTSATGGAALSGAGDLFEFGAPAEGDCVVATQGAARVEGQRFTSLAHSAPLALFATGSELGAVQLWSAGGELQPVGTVGLIEPRCTVAQLQFMGQQLLAARTVRGGAHLFDVATHERLPLPAVAGSVTAMAAHRRKLVLGTNRGSLVVVDPRQPGAAQTVQLQAAAEAASSVRVLAGDQSALGALTANQEPYALCGGRRGRAPLPVHSSATAVAVCENHLVVGSSRGEVLVYDARNTRELLREFEVGASKRLHVGSFPSVHHLHADETKIVYGTSAEVGFLDWSRAQRRSHAPMMDGQALTCLDVSGPSVAVGGVFGGWLLRTNRRQPVVATTFKRNLAAAVVASKNTAARVDPWERHRREAAERAEADRRANEDELELERARVAAQAEKVRKRQEAKKATQAARKRAGKAASKARRAARS